MTADANEIFNCIISCEISTYMHIHGPDKAVVPISNIASLLKWTKYRIRKALKELRELELIEYTSQGCPALVSYGEYTELICEAQPPINGYALTKQGFETEIYKKRYSEWEKGLAKWANMEEEKCT